MRGVSPIVATVLLIATTVTIAGIVNIWLNNFTESTEKLKRESERQSFCANVKIFLDNLNYCEKKLSGIIWNNGMVNIENLTVYIIYNNGSLEVIDLNTTIDVGSISFFNVSINDNYYLVRFMITSCKGNVLKEIERSDISTCQLPK